MNQPQGEPQRIAVSSDLLHCYEARVLRVVDGDTLKVDVDLGFGVHYCATVRLLGINCPEAHGESKERGKAASEFTASWISTHSDNGVVFLRSHDARGLKQEKYGRWLALVLPRTFPVLENDAPGSGWDMSLNAALVNGGLAALVNW